MSRKRKLSEIFWGPCLGRHDSKACRRATGRAWTDEKIHHAMSVRPDVPPVPRGHDPKRHEAWEGRARPLAWPKSHLSVGRASGAGVGRQSWGKRRGWGRCRARGARSNSQKKICVSKFGKTFGCRIAFLLDKLNPTCQKENPTRSKIGTLGGAIVFFFDPT